MVGSPDVPNARRLNSDRSAVGGRPVRSGCLRRLLVFWWAYLIHWLTAWVREYGVDGFRCDTVKHVGSEAWGELKAAAVQALREWKATNPEKKLDDLDFWMTGGVWGHGAERSHYFDHGFDSMINFDFQALAAQPESMEQTFAEYARRINADPQFNPRHPAIAAGSHTQIAAEPYTFSRTLQQGGADDRVVIVIGAVDETTVEVGEVFADGSWLRDAYSGNEAQVRNGQAKLQAHPKGVMLIERSARPPQ